MRMRSRIVSPLAPVSCHPSQRRSGLFGKFLDQLDRRARPRFPTPCGVANLPAQACEANVTVDRHACTGQGTGSDTGLLTRSRAKARAMSQAARGPGRTSRPVASRPPRCGDENWQVDVTAETETVMDWGAPIPRRLLVPTLQPLASLRNHLEDAPGVAR